MTRSMRTTVLALHFVCAIALVGVQRAAAQNQPPFPDELPDFLAFQNARPLLLPDGSTILTGYTTRGLGVVKVTPNGVPDRHFGTNGLAELLGWGLPPTYKSVIVRQDDGRLLAAADFKDHTFHPLRCDQWYVDCNFNIVLFRLEADGRQDTSFNGYGRLVLRFGNLPPPAPESATWRYEEGAEVYLEGIDLLSDGTIIVRTEGATARVRADGSLDTSFLDPPFQARENDFIAAVPFYNEALDQYFVATDLAEIANLARGADNGWQAQDGWFHVYPAGYTLAPSVPVCRFYGRPEAGLDSHLESANADECAALEAAGDGKWILESREAYRVELPDPVTGECAADRVPVYRLWNGRRDSGHLLTSSVKRRDYLLSTGYIAEGWGEHGVAMCSAP